jgi:hypothetical protein
MKAYPTLVWTNSHAVLHPIATIDPDPAMIIGPANAEHDDAFRLDHALQQGMLGVVRVLTQKRLQTFEYLMDSLQVFRLIGVALSQVLKEKRAIEHGVYMASLRRLEFSQQRGRARQQSLQ